MEQRVWLITVEPYPNRSRMLLNANSESTPGFLKVAPKAVGVRL